MDELLKRILALPDIPFNQRSWKCICEDIDKLKHKNIHSIRKLFQSREYIELEPKTLNQLFNYFNQWLIIRALARLNFKYLSNQWLEYFKKPIPSEALIPLISHFTPSKKFDNETLLKKLDWLSFTSSGIMGYQMTTLYAAIARNQASSNITDDNIDPKVHHLSIIIHSKFKLKALEKYTNDYYNKLLIEIRTTIKEHDPISYAQYYQNSSYSLQEILDQILLETEFYDKPTPCYELIHPFILKIKFTQKIKSILDVSNMSVLSKVLSLSLSYKEFKSTYNYLFPKTFSLYFFEKIFDAAKQYSEQEKILFDMLDHLEIWTEQHAKEQLNYECEYFSSNPNIDISFLNIHPSHS